MPEMIGLRWRVILCRTDMCAFGLCDPSSKMPMRSDTGVLVSSELLAQAVSRRCPGHAAHQRIEGAVDG
eukprot:6321928-Alexandrium_andersonii.AAC.1